MRQGGTLEEGDLLHEEGLRPRCVARDVVGRAAACWRRRSRLQVTPGKTRVRGLAASAIDHTHTAETDPDGSPPRATGLLRRPGLGRVRPRGLPRDPTAVPRD